MLTGREISPLGFANGMDEVGIGIGIIIILEILLIYLLIDQKKTGKIYLDEYDQDLEEMKNSLDIVAQVIQRLPEMFPQFQINESPLSQILQFFQNRAQVNEASYSAEQLRSDNGRFEHGETEEQEEFTQTE